MGLLERALYSKMVETTCTVSHTDLESTSPALEAEEALMTSSTEVVKMMLCEFQA